MKAVVAVTALAASFFGSIDTAQAVTLTFDELSTRQGIAWRAIGPTYSAEGFELFATGPSYLPAVEFFVADSGRPEWTGTPGLVLQAVGGRIELRSVDHSPFNLQSIDISRGDTNTGLIPVAFTGLRADGTMVSSIYRFSDDVLGQNETFDFDLRFQYLTSVVWYQGAEWHQFDNIRLSLPVVEPDTATLLLAGGLAALVRKRRRSQGAERESPPANFRWLSSSKLN